MMAFSMATTTKQSKAGPRTAGMGAVSTRQPARPVNRELFPSAPHKAHAPVVHHSEEEDTNEYKRVAWAAALKFAGVPFAKKGTLAYEKVWKQYTEVELPKYTPAAFGFWADACMQVTGISWVKSTDPYYAEVRDLYKWMMERVDNLQNPRDFSEYPGFQAAKV